MMRYSVKLFELALVVVAVAVAAAVVLGQYPGKQHLGNTVGSS